MPRNEVSEVENNIKYSLKELDNEENAPEIDYDELVKEVDEEFDKCAENEEEQVDYPVYYDSDEEIHQQFDDYYAAEMHYNTNFTKKQLEKVADYYEISKRKKTKQMLIEEIVIFEAQPENFEITHRRNKLWRYMNEIKEDKYLSKFLILD